MYLGIFQFLVPPLMVRLMFIAKICSSFVFEGNVKCSCVCLCGALQRHHLALHAVIDKTAQSIV